MPIDTSKIWPFPMKPVRITEANLDSLKLESYTIEPKLDGHRSIVIYGHKIEVWSRQKNKIQVPKHITEQLQELLANFNTILDGEIWMVDKRGGYKNEEECHLSFWDIIRYNGKDVSKFPIEERRSILNEITKVNLPNIKPVKVFEATKENYFSLVERAKKIREERAIQHGFIHGVVLKKNGSPRRDHCSRSIEHPDWLKILWPKMEGWEPKNLTQY